MKRFIFIMIALTIMLQAASIFAGDVRRTLKTLAQISPHIITGKVTRVVARAEKENGREVIFTYVTISVESVLKGDVDKPQLKIKMLGGRVGNKGGWSEEWIPFKQDEEALLFLHEKDRDNGIWEIKSISGKIPIVFINGEKQFDCSMLRTDNKMQYKKHDYIKKNVIFEKINEYTQDFKKEE